MPVPSTFPDWDTNATHTTPVLAGHTTDGFINSEVPGSAELNQWMMFVGLWIRYLSQFMQVQVHQPMDFKGETATGKTAFNDAVWGAGSSPSWNNSGVPGDVATVYSTMRYAVGGFKIASVTWRCRNATAFTTETSTCKIMRIKADGSAFVTGAEEVATLTHTYAAGGGTAVCEAATMTVNHTVDSTYVYWLVVKFDQGLQFFDASVTPG